MNLMIMQKIDRAIRIASLWYEVPVDIVRAIAWQESNWGKLGDNTKILSFDEEHGKGIMQIDDRFHLIAKHDSIFDILLNIAYGTRYLRVLYNQSKSWNTAVINYNGSSEYLQLINRWLELKPWVDKLK